MKMELTQWFSPLGGFPPSEPFRHTCQPSHPLTPSSSFTQRLIHHFPSLPLPSPHFPSPTALLGLSPKRLPGIPVLIPLKFFAFLPCRSSNTSLSPFFTHTWLTSPTHLTLKSIHLMPPSSPSRSVLHLPSLTTLLSSPHLISSHTLINLTSSLLHLLCFLSFPPTSPDPSSFPLPFLAGLSLSILAPFLSSFIPFS